ncbi:MAG: hypothetical protein PHE83_17590 [Opitutaceae bacterium]|nr:hypothetical protein [Opitutaceae bacterium]
MPEVSSFLANLSAAAREELAIDDGTVANIAYLEHRLAKNWVARVVKDYEQTGGLAREFFEHGPRDRVFLLNDLAPGQWLEFGGDKVTSQGAKKVRRQYRVIVEVRTDNLIVRPVKFEEIGKVAGTAPSPPANPLAVFPDEAIMAEVKRRGLMLIAE